MRVSVNKENLMKIVKEKAILECTQKHCPLVPDMCEGKLTYSTDNGWDVCNNDATIVAWLDIKDLPDDNTDEYLLSTNERVILRNLPPKYKYISRDANDGYIYLYDTSPIKGETVWGVPNGSAFCKHLPFNHLFQCVQWTDEKPWLITDLLKAKKPTVDWSKVAVDTKVLVHWSDGSWGNRHFAEYKNGVVYCFDGGKTSFTVHSSLDKKGTMSRWEDVKLYEDGEE